MLEIDAATNTPVEPRKRGGRRRARLTKAQAPEVMLRLAFDQIVADQRRLVKIIENAEDARDFAKLRGDQTDAAIYEAIRERAETRLRWFARQGEKVA